MPKEFRGLLSGEISRIDSKTEFSGKNLSNVARKATVVSPTSLEDKPAEEIVVIEGETLRVFAYRIYMQENVGNSDLGTSFYPMPGTKEEAEYLEDFPEEEREYQKNQLILSATKVGYLIRSNNLAETFGYGSEVFATPIQTGLLSERFIITPTGNKQKLNASRGLTPSVKLDPNFSNLKGQEQFFNENGRPVTQQAGSGSVTLFSDNVNYSCLTDEVKAKITELANSGPFDLVVTSAYRTAADAQRVGSTTNSKHNTGQAVDFRVTSFANGKVLNEEGQRLVRIAKEIGFAFPVGIDHGQGLHFHFEYTGGSKQTRQECSEEELSSFYATEETGNT
jgi:hypothetical protein